MTNEIAKAIARTEAEKVAGQNNFLFTLTTEDATPVNIATIEIPEYTTGHLEIDLAAILEDGSDKLTAKIIAGFHKDTVLTIDTLTTLHSQNFIAGSAFDVVDDSENPAIEITGVAATNIHWQARVNQFLLTITPVLP